MATTQLTQAKKASTNINGVINKTDLYTVNAFRLRLNLTDSAWRALRDRGLPVIRVGKRAFVSGRDAVAFLQDCTNDNQSEDHQTGPRQPCPTMDRPGQQPGT